MAEAFGNILGAGVIDPYSSGSRPSGAVNGKAIASMQEVGYDLSSHTSKSLTDIPPVEYDVVVTMGCGDECPFVRARRRLEWNIPDPKQMDMKQFGEVRDLIREKVRRLIENLSQRGAPGLSSLRQ